MTHTSTLEWMVFQSRIFVSKQTHGFNMQLIIQLTDLATAIALNQS